MRKKSLLVRGGAAALSTSGGVDGAGLFPTLLFCHSREGGNLEE
jgi:hypothetical protein